jgi:hypothetical protein
VTTAAGADRLPADELLVNLALVMKFCWCCASWAAVKLMVLAENDVGGQAGTVDVSIPRVCAEVSFASYYQANVPFLVLHSYTGTPNLPEYCRFQSSIATCRRALSHRPHDHTTGVHVWMDAREVCQNKTNTKAVQAKGNI